VCSGFSVPGFETRIYSVVATPKQQDADLHLSKSACLPWWGFCPDLEDVLEVNNERQVHGGATTYLLVPDLKHILEVQMKSQHMVVLLFLDLERVLEIRTITQGCGGRTPTYLMFRKK
jgi:hypothetical protein